MEKQIFRVEGMSCASCASSVESILNAVDGVESAVVNLAASTLNVKYNEKKISETVLKNALEPAGYKLTEDINFTLEKEEALRKKHINTLKFNLIGSAIFSIPVFILSMFFHHYHNLYWVQLVLCLPVVLWFGRQFYIIGVKRLLHGAASMDSLIALGTGSAFLFSILNVVFANYLSAKGFEPQVYFESAVVIITFILLGRFIEEKAKHNTSSSIRKLMGLQVQTAILVEDEKETEIGIETIVPGNKLRVRPGEKIPVDGYVTQGYTYIDESMISGESAPVLKNKNDAVIGGTINQSGSIIIEATRIGSDTVLAQIIKHVKEAQGSKAPIQKLADKISSIFVPIVIVISLISFAAWFFLANDNPLYYAFNTLFTVLVIACPCALGLATPTAMVVGIGKSAEYGILIKDASSLEKACEITDLVVDKTGTLTTGIQRVTDVFPSLEKLSSQDISILLAAEKQSEHPTAKAVRAFLENNSEENITIDKFNNIAGMGIEVDFENNKYFIGNDLLMGKNGISVPESISQKATLLKKEAKTVIYFANQENVIAILAIQDTIKETTPAAIEKLKSLGIKIHLLSGDNEQVVNHTAVTTGIGSYISQAQPATKAQFIKHLQESGSIVAMAGDGINDAPALAQADVSFAMENGTDIAMDSAQMVLLHGDLTKIAQAISFSKATVKTIKTNLFWAFFYNIITIPLAAGLFYPLFHIQLSPMIAGAAMAFSSVTVVFNSILLKMRIRNTINI